MAQQKSRRRLTFTVVINPDDEIERQLADAYDRLSKKGASRQEFLARRLVAGDVVMRMISGRTVARSEHLIRKFVAEVHSSQLTPRSRAAGVPSSKGVS